MFSGVTDAERVSRRKDRGPLADPKRAMPETKDLRTKAHQMRYAYRVTLDEICRAGRTRGFSPTHWLVLLCIRTHHNQERGYAWPTMTRMADLINREPSSVKKAVKDLHNWGFIVRVYVKMRGNRYFLTEDPADNSVE